MIVKTIVQGLVAAALIAVAGLAWAEVAGPPAVDPDRGGEQQVVGGGNSGYLPEPLRNGRDHDHDDDRHEREEDDDDD